MAKYIFNYIAQCNMCNSPSEKHKILGKRLSQSQGKWPKKKIGVAITIVRCNICGLIYSNPLPIPESIEDHYNMPPDHYWNEEYFSFREDYFDSQITRFRSLSVEKNNLRALDVGAGLGKCMVALRRAGFEVSGIEASDTFYQVAIQKTGISKSQLQLAAIEDAVLDSNYFDFITFGAVLEHLYDPSGAIQRAMRWLKPGGLIHVEVPSSAWLVSKIGNLFYRMIGTDYVTNLSPMHPPYHMYEFSLLSFQLHARNNHYEIAHHQHYVCQTFMPKFLDPILNRIMMITNTGMQLEVWLRKLPACESNSDVDRQFEIAGMGNQYQ